jgi:3-deoxy-manno-octulosonate cytidylyltransferase (CMP-KDO synthetase)
MTYNPTVLMKKNNKFIIVIPARFKSSRLPGKPLKDICGKPMLLRTFEVCAKVIGKEDIYVATDNKAIVEMCKKNSINYLLTSAKCKTGTDRVAEVSKKIKKIFYINVQGDEPLFNPIDLKKLITNAKRNPLEIINGYCSINSKNDYFNYNIPKVVFDKKKYLMYMSRAPIPASKKKSFTIAWRQVCAYSLPYNALKFFYKNKKKTRVEKQEDCELVRFLENGFRVKMLQMSSKSIAVDTPHDLKKVRNIFKTKKN